MLEIIFSRIQTRLTASLHCQKLFKGLMWPSNFFKPLHIGQYLIFKMKMVFELSFWNLIVDMDIDIILNFW